MFMMSCELLLRHLEGSVHLFIISFLTFRQYFFCIRHGAHYMVDNKLLVNV